MRTNLAVLFLAAAAHVAGAQAQTAVGVVFHDINANGVRDAGEPGVPRVLVSNGRDLVRTGGDGSYELPVDDDTVLFVCKPRGWMVPLNEDNLPRHFYLHKPAGSPDLRYGGVEPTGPLPESVDFPLTPQDEHERFNVVFFGDPQPYTIAQVDHFKNDIIPEVQRFVTDEGAAFGVTLGDIVGDDLRLFDPVNATVAAVGVPWLNVFGNHDMDFDASSDEHADETFNRVYGPTTYAFQYAHVHFIVLDNVMYHGQKDNGDNGGYHAELTEDQRAFVTAYFNQLRGMDLQRQRVVLLMHIPAVEFEDFFNGVTDGSVPEFLMDFAPLSLAAHWHRQQHYMMELGGRPHHHLVAATTSGSWWQGAADEYAIPHAMMRDGKPNGWSVLTIDPALPRGYEIRFKAAGKPWHEQMHIVAPDVIRARAQSNEPRRVTVNLWSGGDLSKVEMRCIHAQTGDATAWRTMRVAEGVDPYWARLKRLEEAGEAPKMTTLNANTRLWIADLPDSLATGSHTIEVRETNMFGHTHTARRIVRVIE